MRRSKISLFSFLNHLVEWGAFITGAATGVLYIVNSYGRYHIDEKFVHLLFAAFLGLGVVWYIIRRLIQVLKDAMLKMLRRGISERYATADEVDMVHNLCRSFYPRREDHVINKGSLRDFMLKDSRTAKIFFKNNQPVGLYIVFSINAEAVRRYRAGDFRSAQALNKRYAVGDRGEPAGLYVTNIAARGFSAQGLAVESLEEDLNGRPYNPRYGYAFARFAPENEDGPRLLRKFHFQPIFPDRPDEQIWQRTLGK